MLDIVFHKSTWLQGTIEANTKAELLDVYELWQSSAEEHLSNILSRGSDVVGDVVIDSTVTMDKVDIELGSSSRLQLQQHLHDTGDSSSSAVFLAESSHTVTSPVITRVTSRSSMSSMAGKTKSSRGARTSRDKDSRSDCDSRAGTSTYGSDDGTYGRVDLRIFCQSNPQTGTV